MNKERKISPEFAEFLAEMLEDRRQKLAKFGPSPVLDDMISYYRSIASKEE